MRKLCSCIPVIANSFMSDANKIDLTNIRKNSPSHRIIKL